MMKDYSAAVVYNGAIAESIYMITLDTGEEDLQIRGGQFAELSVGDGSFPLRRPLGIMKSEGGTVSLCYQIKGEGTKRLSAAKAGDRLRVLMPLGNGFDLGGYRDVAVIGGGVGIFPLIAAIRQNYRDINFYSYIGFRTKSAVCLLDELERSRKLTVVTDDGSYGSKSNAVEAFLADYANISADAVIACGPPVMLKALKTALSERGIDKPCFVSLEERMGCGIGACLVCVCRLTDGTNARVCRDGPVFEIGEVEL